MNAGLHTTLRTGLVALVAALHLAGCADVPTGSGEARTGEPQLLINGVDDFDRTAVAAIMVYDPNHSGRPVAAGMRSSRCTTIRPTRIGFRA